MKLIDVSLPIYEGMPVYPGTAATKITSVKSGSGTSELSEIMMTSHAATHVDAPRHVLPDGKTLGQLNLGVFYGLCRVLDVTSSKSSVSKQDLEPKSIQPGERILLRTGNSIRGFAYFIEDYVYLRPEAAIYLAECRIALLGIDALSVKKRGDKDNTSHMALLSKDIPIIEGLDLSKAEEGEYTLAAFPLALKGDGAPARAVLIR